MIPAVFSSIAVTTRSSEAIADPPTLIASGVALLTFTMSPIVRYADSARTTNRNVSRASPATGVKSVTLNGACPTSGVVQKLPLIVVST